MVLINLSQENESKGNKAVLEKIARELASAACADSSSLTAVFVKRSSENNMVILDLSFEPCTPEVSAYVVELETSKGGRYTDNYQIYGR